MREHTHLYIDGTWTEPVDGHVLELTDQTDGTTPTGRVALGGGADVDRAVKAAARAAEGYSRTTPAERADLLTRVLAAFDERAEDLAEAVTAEMGAPGYLARGAHVPTGRIQIATAIGALKEFPFAEIRGGSEIRQEPLGVAGLITPWNFPVLQMAGKTASALAAGCPVVLKPAETAPHSAAVFAEIMHAAGSPPGVFNLVHGSGAIAGEALSAHPDVEVISFTGSLATAQKVTVAAAGSMKLVHTELGGKSPQVLLPDADLSVAIDSAHQWMMNMTGQICSAPSRTLVHRERQEEFLRALVPTLEALPIGDPRDPRTRMGPMASAAQWETVQRYVRAGIKEGARLVTGGPGRPEGLERGHFVRPTVFADVHPSMTIAREEIFGPVMSVIAYDTVDEAVALANDTTYGLAAYVVGERHAEEVASRIRAGCVLVNDAEFDWTAPWGGFKRSGNGREFGADGISGYLAAKVVRRP